MESILPDPFQERGSAAFKAEILFLSLLFEWERFENWIM